MYKLMFRFLKLGPIEWLIDCFFFMNNYVLKNMLSDNTFVYLVVWSAYPNINNLIWCYNLPNLLLYYTLMLKRRMCNTVLLQYCFPSKNCLWSLIDVTSWYLMKLSWDGVIWTQSISLNYEQLSNIVVRR